MKKMNNLAELVRNWSGTSTSGLKRDGSLDKRKFRSVMQDAWVMGILDEEGNFCSGCFYPSQWKPALLWEILKPAIYRSTGIALSRDRAWRDLGIWEASSKWHTPEMLQDMEAVLTVLSSSGYIYFNCAGSVWSVSVKNGKPNQ